MGIGIVKYITFDSSFFSYNIMKISKFISFLFLAFLFSFKSEIYAWRSALYPVDWTPGYTDAQGRFLHDFSYAGYMKGELEIPSTLGIRFVDVTEAPYNADNTGTDDCTNAIQQAINDVGQNGGGIVYLPAGTYKLKPQGSSSSALSISYSNLILRGAGKDLTFIRCYEENMRFKQIINVSNGGNWNSPEDGNTYELALDIPETPTDKIYIKSGIENLKVGDWIIIRSDRSADWIAEHSMGGFWNINSTRGTTFYRQITGISASNRQITLDIPSRYRMKRSDNARVYKVTPKLHDVGLENFSIGNKMQSNTTGWAEEDYKVSTNGSYQVDNAFMIKFSLCIHSWAKDISTYSAENPTNMSFGTVHMSSNGMDLNQCRNITVENCEFSYPQYEGGGGNGYGWNICAQECLIVNCRSLSPRHAYSFKYAYGSGNVLLNFYSGNGPKYGSDFHMYLPMSNLIDGQNIDGDYIESNVRPYGGTAGDIHGFTSSNTVFWNTYGIAYKSGFNYIVESRQYKYGYIIGTRGKATGVKTTPLVMTSTYGTVDTSPEDFVEGLGTGSDLEPVSLYYDQLAKRLKQDVCIPVTSSVVSDANLAYNVLDGDLNTHWAAEGKNIRLDFCLGGEMKSVSAVKIAFYQGDSRISKFDIWSSENAVNWRPAQRNIQSSGKTAGFETFTLTQPVNAKYIRILGLGNNTSEWNSINEVEFVMQPSTDILQPKTVEEKMFSIFPNPLSENQLTLELNTQTINREATVNIIDMLGKTVFLKNFVPESKQITINQLNLLKGSYIVKLNSERQQLATLLLVQ
jgi:hypothetical protein